MAANTGFAAHCVELLSPLGRTRAGRMFGGHGFYVDDLFIALAAAERLYLKTDEHTRPKFEAAGCEPFTYQTRDGERTLTSYWTAPDEALESPALMLPWARLAMEAALRARNAKPAKKRAAPRKRAAASTPAAKASPKKPAAQRRRP